MKRKHLYLLLGLAVTLLCGLALAWATYYAPSLAEETKYRLEHQPPTTTTPTPKKPKKVVYSFTWTREEVE